MTKIIVAIPCYRCERQISRVIGDFDEFILDRVDEVIVIDNQSKDGTLQAACDAIDSRKTGSSKFRVFRNTQNYGLGGSHKVAFLYALQKNAEYLAIVHGDHQATTRELKELIDLADSNPGVDAILGARFMRNSRLQGYSRIRTYGNRGLNWFYAALSCQRTYDLGSGLNLFRMEALKDRRFLGYSNQFTFNMDLLLDFYYKRSKVLFHPITWSETDQISNAKALKVGWITLKTAMKWRLNPRRPEFELAQGAYTYEVVH